MDDLGFAQVQQPAMALGASIPDPAEVLPFLWAGSAAARFRNRCRTHPGDIALVDEGQTLTYAEVDRWSETVAAWLRMNGAGPEDVVAIHASRCAALPVAMLAVWKVGAAFVILDQSYPVESLRLRLEQCNLRAWLATSGPSPALPSGVAILDVNRCSGDPAAWADPADEPDVLAYIAFTSGTTGTPRAIEGTHRPVSHFLDWYSRRFDIHSRDRFAMLSGLAHDPLLRDIFAPWWNGAALYIPSEDTLKDPAKLVHFLAANRISVMHVTPSLARVITSAAYGKETLTDIRYVFSGGERLTYWMAARIGCSAPNATLVNFYGATETPQAMAYSVVPEDVTGFAEQDAVPLGRGIEGVQILVAAAKDECGVLAMAAPGEEGEICIRTPYLTRGYLDSNATRERFLANPFARHSCLEANDRVYMTGDFGVMGNDGIVRFVGRKDSQTKIRGFRVETGEVEAMLRLHGGVADVIVVPVDQARGTFLTAFVIPSSLEIPTRSELRRFAAGRLPAYAVPASINFVPGFPLTPNGKIDLPALTRSLPGQCGKEDPAGLKQVSLAVSIVGLFAKVLPTPPQSEDDDFFDLGGDSLGAIDLLAALEGQCGCHLSLADLTMARTPARLAERIVQENDLCAPLVIPLNNFRGGQPVFFVHPLHGNVVVFEKMARCLRLPSYGLRSPGLDGSEPPETIEKMATLYLREVRAVQPDGPYLLAGYSAGGAIAYEMARRLEREGIEAAVIAMDTSMAVAGRWSWVVELGLKIRTNAVQLRSMGQGSLAPFLRTKWLNTRMNLQMVAARVRRGQPRREGRRTPRQAWEHTATTVGIARKNYRPGPFSGRVTLLLAGDELLARRRQTVESWRRLVRGELVVRTVPGDHDHMLDERYASGLAECIESSAAALSAKGAVPEPVSMMVRQLD